MSDLLIQILVGSYGAFLLVVITLLIRVLINLHEKQSTQHDTIQTNKYIIREIKGEQIPTIRIEVEKLETRTDVLEHRASSLEHRADDLEKRANKHGID